MPFVESSAVATAYGITDDARLDAMIEEAESDIAAWLGTTTLVRHTVTEEKHTAVRTKYVIETDDGPITGAPTVTVDDEAVDAGDLTYSHWQIGIADGFAKDAVLLLTYTAGWAEIDSAGDTDAPTQITKAIMRLAALKYLNPEGKQSERLGDYSYTRAEAEVVSNGVSLPGSIAGSINRWRKPNAGG